MSRSRRLRHGLDNLGIAAISALVGAVAALLLVWSVALADTYGLGYAMRWTSAAPCARR